MTRISQAFILSILGALLLRMGASDEHLRYVQPWMRWGLITAGGLLVAVPLGYLWLTGDEVEHDDDADHEHKHTHRIPFAAWLLLLPTLVVALVAPQPLGSYVAERRANVAPPDPIAFFEPLPAGDPLEMKLVDFVSRAQIDTKQTLRGRRVALTGFVTRDGDAWFVTRIGIRCCAADSIAWKVRVAGVTAPPADSWVTVIGTWQVTTVSTSGAAPTPVLEATEVLPVDEPRNPYE